MYRITVTSAISYIIILQTNYLPVYKHIITNLCLQNSQHLTLTRKKEPTIEKQGDFGGLHRKQAILFLAIQIRLK